MQFNQSHETVIDGVVSIEEQPTTELELSTYPQHEKLNAVKDQSQAIGDFLEWLNEKDFVVAKFDARNCMLYPEYLAMDRILAEYFEIDLDALEAEKRAMLAGSARQWASGEW